MAKVYEFPMKKRLPKGIETEIHRIAKSYVEVLYGTLVLLTGDEYTDEEFMEINDMVTEAYAEGLLIATDELVEKKL